MGLPTSGDDQGESTRDGTGRRGRGRPRSAEAHQAILTAAAALVTEVGYDGLTMDAVAARAGVGRQTIYRRWSTRAALVAETVLEGNLRTAQMTLPRTGDVEADLREWGAARARSWATPIESSLIRALTVAAAESSDTAAELHRRLTAPEHDTLIERLRDAQRAGELSPAADLDAGAHALVGGLLYAVLARHQPLTEERTRALVATVLAGMRRPHDGTSTPGR